MSEKRAQQALIEQFRLLGQTAIIDSAAVGRSVQALQQISAGGPRPAPLPRWGRLALPVVRATAESGQRLDDTTTIAALIQPLPPTVLLVNHSVKASDMLGRVSVELCAAALGEDPELLHKPALTQAVRFVVALMAATHVGRSIEVRVPPVSACQCGLPGESAQVGTVPGSGPVHTRGTPPNVVETDARTFLALATGRLSWFQARAEYAVRASGSRADLSAMLPVVDVA